MIHEPDWEASNKRMQKIGRSPKWPEEGGDSERSSRLSQPQVSTKPSSSGLQLVSSFSCLLGARKNPKEYLHTRQESA